MPANISVTLSTARLAEVAARFPGAVDTVMAAGAERTVAYAKGHHPWQNRTGGTEASAHVEHTGSHQFTLVFGGASIFLEHGTVHMPPYPWVFPAIRATQHDIAGSMAKLGSHL
jgi:hypothetical protein